MPRRQRRAAPRKRPRSTFTASLVLLFLVVSLSHRGILADDKCDSINFTDSQERHYGKTDFLVHSRVAETVGNLLSVFYDESQDSWSISPQDLREIVLSNIHTVEGTKIYGSAIAFEPSLWRQTTGLSDGVPFPAASDACLNLSQRYCESGNNITSEDYRITTLVNTSEGQTLYCPYAYHGSPEEKIFANCSKATPEYCPTMDLARAYDYSNISNPDVEWYTAPRCLFILDGTTTGYWTSPYFDAGAGNINMVTFSQPIVKGDKFLGIATIDIEVDYLCYGNQCENACPAEDYSYTISDSCSSDNSRSITYSSSSPSCPINSNAVSALSCSYVPVSSNIGIVSLTLGSLGACICLAVGLFLIAKRESSLIKASQVRISCCFVAGAFLANIGTFALVGGLSDVKCKLQFWALILPMTMLLAFLFGKVYRAYIVFVAAQKFQRVTVTDRELFLKIFLVILVQVVILLIWTFVEDSRVESLTMTESVDQRYCIGEDCHPAEEQCVENYNIVGIFSIVYLAILVLVGCILSCQSRKLPNCFSEAKYIMLAMYNVGLVAIMIGIVAAVADLAVSAETLLLTFAVFLVATGSVVLVFLPKFIKILSTSEADIANGLRETMRTHHRQRSSNVHASVGEGGGSTQRTSVVNRQSITDRESFAETNGTSPAD